MNTPRIPMLHPFAAIRKALGCSRRRFAAMSRGGCSHELLAQVETCAKTQGNARTPYLHRQRLEALCPPSLCADTIITDVLAFEASHKEALQEYLRRCTAAPAAGEVHDA